MGYPFVNTRKMPADLVRELLYSRGLAQLLPEERSGAIEQAETVRSGFKEDRLLVKRSALDGWIAAVQGCHKTLRKGSAFSGREIGAVAWVTGKARRRHRHIRRKGVSNWLLRVSRMSSPTTP